MTDPAVVYERAHKSSAGDYPTAIRIYEALMARYPFAAESRQSRLDVIYAYYRAGESESAIDAADTFIAENPTHPRVDYAWYLKGLTDFERMPNFMERWFRVDLDKRPPTQARRSFLSFSTVVEQYPNSEYAHDARRRMVYLRNRLADYEIAVARYYVGRGAYVAAAQRAKVAIEEFDGAPAVRQALEIMVYCYDQMELKELAAQTRAMYRNNYEGEVGENKGPPKRSGTNSGWRVRWGQTPISWQKGRAPQVFERATASGPRFQPIVAGKGSKSHRAHEVGPKLRFPCKRDRGTTLARQRVKDRLPARTSRAAQREAISAQVLFGGSFQLCAVSVSSNRSADSSGAPPRASEREKKKWSSISFSQARPRVSAGSLSFTR